MPNECAQLFYSPFAPRTYPCIFTLGTTGKIHLLGTQIGLPHYLTLDVFCEEQLEELQWLCETCEVLLKSRLALHRRIALVKIWWCLSRWHVTIVELRTYYFILRSILCAVSPDIIFAFRFIVALLSIIDPSGFARPSSPSLCDISTGCALPKVLCYVVFCF
jgi:hypothetical protein